MKKHNFSAGPCILPASVFQKASEAILNFNGLDLSILEISHRSPDFIAVFLKAQQLVKKLLKLDDSYEILFLQGGASLQFVMVPFNLMPQDNGYAIYLDTGVWAAKAIQEAKKFGEVEVIKDENYQSNPKHIDTSLSANYLHCTSNNTIYGTQMKEFPEIDVPLVCDMSSDIFSRVIDYTQFDLIYAGAQKNIGPAGATLVVVKKDILGETGRDIPSYLDYLVHIDKKGIFNTPPVFSIYVSMLNLEWLDNQGGVEAMEKLNQQKSDLLYAEIDRNPLFRGFASQEDRSMMNATFYLEDESMAEAFDAIWQNAGINGLHGHRTVGGYRASMYNALPLESVQILVNCMRELENRN
ncbi:3-phosphoserine/phosphohydroxythreonine transaminase [Flavobacteriaceae bacterium Ap0902]|nr:3-phosphoserine/phosphohydroxythreonine transaminase [Flavobacteriaceae bacterium Ap0902]